MKDYATNVFINCPFWEILNINIKISELLALRRSFFETLHDLSGIDGRLENLYKKLKSIQGETENE